MLRYKSSFNALTANYEYSRNNTDNLPLPVQMQLSGKSKYFSRFFIEFFESALNFEHPKTCLLECIKGLVSENPFAVNVLTSP